MENKRKNRRFDCLVPVDSKHESVFDQTQTVDFSKNGIGFISQQEIPVNSEIAIEILLEEDGEPVLVIGKVEWVRPIPHSTQYRIGMTFKDVMRGSKSRLDNYFVNK
ncbi:hypothetical protein MNBD_GAMMA03-988 [hydrothermal vent metagenome]|uniref:PilZ domain-containing protein n=1 Tax=hydrothermal vent metagenome TaxID=652676 RepID=A0A3B0VP51_9ZZZZ